MPAPFRNTMPIAVAVALAIVALDKLTKYLVVLALNLRETGEIVVSPSLASGRHGTSASISASCRAIPG